jgi:hypothetical protein
LREYQEEINRLKAQLEGKGPKKRTKKSKKTKMVVNEDGEEVEVPADEGETSSMTAEQIAEEEARVYAEERAKLEAQKDAMLQDQVRVFYL